ncbi:MAG TPA: hypothetical protein VFF67_04505 [Thermoplasmata archaeon]|nr:hypothetical protein [Thermoplasmata archaeon]
MSEGYTGHGAARAPASRKSVGFIVLAALLIGAGLFVVMMWVIALPADWAFAFGLLPVAIGSTLLFLPQTGSDR